MSKVTLALLLLFSAAVYDPPRALRLLDSNLQIIGSIAQTLGAKLKSALNLAPLRWSR